jgi:transcriptional regulator with XRE-family HTH domain
MLHMSGIIRKIKQHKGSYRSLAEEIGITYSQLYNIVSKRTKSPRWDVYELLRKWIEK